MIKIKLFGGSLRGQLEADVNDWIKENKPMIEDVRFSTNQSDCKNILILYRER